MEKDIHKCFDKLAEALSYTACSDIESITPCIDHFTSNALGAAPEAWQKEVAEIRFRDGHCRYVDIGGATNLSAMWCVLRLLMGQTDPSAMIQRVEPVPRPPEPAEQAEGAV